MRHLTGFDSEQGHGYISRPLTRTEMQFFSYTLDEREAIEVCQFFCVNGQVLFLMLDSISFR